MLAITISWVLVCEVSEALKDMIEHETHFISNLIDEGLIVSAMGTSSIEDVWRIKTVSGFNVNGQILKFPKLFNDLFTGHEGFWMGTKSTISPIEVGWWKEGFILHVIVKWKRLASDLFKCGKWWWICTSWWQVLKFVQVKSGDDLLDEMSMMLVRATFLGGFLVEEEALEAIFGDELKGY
ncbi:hypothetical protein Tco_0450205 [Tanacetum coccineum]